MIDYVTGKRAIEIQKTHPEIDRIHFFVWICDSNIINITIW